VNVLGLDTSTAASAACVVRADGAAFEERPSPARLAERPAHAAELLPAAARCLAAAGLGWRDLDAVAVGIGPGAFTGLRIGVATARALASANGLAVHPVSSLAALAEGARETVPAAAGRPLLALIDARRGELFAALYAPIALWGPVALAPAAAAERAGGCETAPLAVGDGALRYRDELIADGIDVAPADSPAHAVSALAVCRLAAAAEPVAPAAVLPDYLRDPDAVARPG